MNPGSLMGASAHLSGAQQLFPSAHTGRWTELPWTQLRCSIQAPCGRAESRDHESWKFMPVTTNQEHQFLTQMHS